MPDRGFIQQKKLIELRLSNNKIFRVTNSTFDGLKTVTILSLRKNFLEELSSLVFSSLTRVEELDLGQNRIRSVEANTFTGLSRLRVLYLDDNDLQQVPTPALTPLPHLAELNLALNNIKEIVRSPQLKYFYIKLKSCLLTNDFPALSWLTIPLQSLSDHSFSPIVSLYSLDLEGNAILNISRLAFSGLESVRVLSLAANSLNQVPTSQLANMERLEELRLANNYFSSLPSRAFRGLRKLRSLDLSDCPELRSVSSTALADNDNLARLSLSGCREVQLSLQPGALLSLSQLTNLQLADLAWRTVERDLVQWDKIQVVDLGYNPLHCSCDLAWLRDVLASATNISRATCHSPTELAGLELREVARSDLRCGGQGGGGAVYHSLVAGLCVLAALTSALVLVAVVHCQKKVCRLWRCYRQCCPSWPSDHCDNKLSGEQRQSLSDTLYYTDRSLVSLPGELYYHSQPPLPASISPDQYQFYQSATKSTVCEDDYFLSLSKDRKTFKPIRVCEL